MSDTILSLWNELVGTYTPYVSTNGFATDWGYVGASVITILGFWFLLKLLLVILKGVLKNV